ncbi:MAG TPA: hypothetical protein VGM37_13060 [Armatimonadota bacterium]|jgi:hypothetical protein
MEIIDVESDPAIPLKDRARYWHYEFTEAGQVADALRRFLEALEGAGG